MDQTNGGTQAAGLLSAFSQLGAGFSNSNAESSASQFKASQLQLSSQTAALQASSTINAANQQSTLTSKKVATAEGQARANYGAQGVAVDTGSAAAVQSSTASEGALAEQTIQSNAWREAWGFDIQNLNDKSEADMTTLEGENQANNTMLTGGMNALADITKGFTPKETK